MRSNKFLALALAVIITLLPVALQAQSTFPNFAKTSLLAYRYTAGTINNGGHAVSIAAGTGSATASKTDCSAPSYASCNFVYANSSGTVAVTTTMATALATGDTILALMETDGTGITKITQAPLSSAVPTIGPFMQITDCVASISCASPVSTAAGVKIAYGTGTLTSASPSLAHITAISPAYTSTSTIFCTASPIGTSATVAAAGLAVNIVSSSAFDVTGPNTVTTTFNWICIGY